METNQYDYPSIAYPIPFNKLVSDKSMRYVDFGKRDARFPPEIEFGEVQDASFQDVDHIFVTGSSSNHLYSNINTMYSIMLSSPRASIVFVDFGLDAAALSALIREMRFMVDYFKSHSHARIYYRKFDFSHFPAWWSINDEATRGGYAWKVISYFDVLLESKRLVAWSDGGNQLPRSLDKELERAHKYGLFTPYSGGVLQSWLHGSSAKFLQNHHMLRKVLLGKGMCTGGYLFIDYANDAVMRTVVFPLVECAYTKKCISPEGSSRKNHRQDQAILTALVQSARIEKSCIAIKSTGVRYHQECDSDESCRKSREFLKGLLRVH
ncbi:hypothetical protein AV274_3139 [Blastocystis sp. ATCC 50177/Nand II]|uniref:Uncharacterized protein n=1 Tax=Blastocystis sp. subtype 1 (strain ATCC 50177 / NandII) TaxID=478820 RepID=A0A196SDS2_BLAHN|nr:hypothetical protein AV274_3139 [Blastocystis sp. ATCC 50177/Nand II]